MMFKVMVTEMFEMQHVDSVQRKRRTHERGMTLIEIMIVIVIIGMIGTGVTMAYMKQTVKANAQIATNESCLIRSAVMLYMTQNAGKCPTLDNLKDGYLDSGRRTEDPWGNPYVIDCESGEPEVYSTGKEGNEHFGCNSGG
jgi:general secretion pathway protein G